LLRIDRRGAGTPSRRPDCTAPQAIHKRAYGNGSLDEMADAERANYFFAANPMQAAADATTTLRAIRGAAEDTGFDARLQIGGVIGGHLRE